MLPLFVLTILIILGVFLVVFYLPPPSFRFVRPLHLTYLLSIPVSRPLGWPWEGRRRGTLNDGSRTGSEEHYFSNYWGSANSCTPLIWSLLTGCNNWAGRCGALVAWKRAVKYASWHSTRQLILFYIFRCLTLYHAVLPTAAKAGAANASRGKRLPVQYRLFLHPPCLQIRRPYEMWFSASSSSFSHKGVFPPPLLKVVNLKRRWVPCSRKGVFICLPNPLILSLLLSCPGHSVVSGR